MSDEAGTAAPSPEQPQGKSKMPFILAGCGCLALVVAICAGGIYMMVSKGYALFTAPPDAVRAHIAHVASGDVRGAYEGCSDGLKGSMSLQAFQSYVDANPIIYKSTDVSFTNVNIQNNICNLQGTANGPEGSIPFHAVLYLAGDDPTKSESWVLHEPFD